MGASGHTDQAARMIPLAVSLGLAAHAGPQYHHGSRVPAPNPALTSAWMASDTKAALRQAGLALVVEDLLGRRTRIWPKGDKGAPKMSKLGVEVLQLAYIGARLELPPPYEVDQLAVIGGRDVPTTLQNTGSELVVTLGRRAPEWSAATTTPEDIEALGVFADVAAEDAAWEPEVLAAVAQVLESLTDAERATLADVVLVRDGREGRENVRDARASASFRLGPLPRLEIYGLALQNDGEGRFVGSVRRPYRLLSFVVAHEIGHAIASVEERNELRALIDRQGEISARDADRGLALDAIQAGAADAPSAEHVAAEGAELEREHTEVLAALEALVTRARAASAVEERFWTEVRGSPTPYGWTNRHEAFADAFALYKLDPDALDWVLPEAKSWFDANSHLGDTSSAGMSSER